MNYSDLYSEGLAKKLKKLKAKNRTLFEAIFKKMYKIYKKR